MLRKYYFKRSSDIQKKELTEGLNVHVQVCEEEHEELHVLTLLRFHPSLSLVSRIVMLKILPKSTSLIVNPLSL